MSLQTRQTLPIIGRWLTLQDDRLTSLESLEQFLAGTATFEPRVPSSEAVETAPSPARLCPLGWASAQRPKTGHVLAAYVLADLPQIQAERLFFMGLQDFQGILDKPVGGRPGLGVFAAAMLGQIYPRQPVVVGIDAPFYKRALLHLVDHPAEHRRPNRDGSGDIAYFLAVFLQQILQDPKMNIGDIQLPEGGVSKILFELEDDRSHLKGDIAIGAEMRRDQFLSGHAHNYM